MMTNTPVLHLDGAILHNAFDSMIECSEKLGGIEMVVEGVRGKSLLFQRTFSGDGNLMTDTEFFDACAFMPTVRRRVQPLLKAKGFEYLRSAITALLDGITLESTDRRILTLKEQLAFGTSNRWIHDLAAEILHYRNPENFPLMTRWIWDSESNSGVLREIWFAEMQNSNLDIPNGIRTHLELRRELHDFLENSGVYANHQFIIDILFAWIYSQYIGSQGGSFLKTEFSQSGTPFDYVMRMLGLDAALTGSGLTHMVLADGTRHRLSELIDASTH